MANDTTIGGLTDAGNSDDSIARDLADLSDDTDVKDGDTEEEGSGEESETDSETEDGSVEEDAEDLEDSEEEEESEKEEEKDKEEEPDAAGHITVKALKTKYPNLFKDFPQLRAAFFEHPKYQEIFPDVESARVANVKADEFDALESSLIQKGDPRLLLKVMAENSPKSFKMVAKQLSEAVKETDPSVYTEFINPVIEDLLYHASHHGLKIGDKNLQLAARHLANFVWANGGDIPDIAKRASSKSEPSEAEKELEQERASHAQEKYNSALSNLVDNLATEMDGILAQKLEGLTTFEKKHVIKDTRLEVDRLLMADKSFQSMLRGLWRRAAESNYNNESKSRIKRAWLDRAKLIAPRVRARVKQEALDGRSKGENTGQAKSSIKLKDDGVTKKRTFPSSGSNSGSSSQSARTVLDPKKIDWRKTSDMDILNSK